MTGKMKYREMVNSLVDAAVKVCDWKGQAEVYFFLNSRDPCAGIFLHRSKAISYYSDRRTIERLMRDVESQLTQMGYTCFTFVYINKTSLIVRPKENHTEFYVLILDILNAPDDIKREFEKFKGKLIKIDELPKEFKIEAGTLGTFLLYKGYVCSKVFFSYSRSGWFNLTHDEPQSPQEHIEEMEAFLQKIGR